MKAPKPIRIVNMQEGAETKFVWPEREITFLHRKVKGRWRLEIAGPNPPKILTKRAARR